MAIGMDWPAAEAFTAHEGILLGISRLPGEIDVTSREKIFDEKRQGSMPMLRQVDGATADLQPGNMEQWLESWWRPGHR